VGSTVPDAFAVANGLLAECVFAGGSWFGWRISRGTPDLADRHLGEGQARAQKQQQRCGDRQLQSSLIGYCTVRCIPRNRNTIAVMAA